MHVSINMDDMPIEVLDITPINPLISKCQIKVCYVGQQPNRNRSVITKEVAKDLANSIPGCPIVGYFNDAEGDYEEHNKVIEIANGKISIKDTTKPYGFVSMDAKVWFQWFEDDGVPHEYLMTEGYIWTGQYPESQRVIDKGNNQSMELDENTLDAFWTKDNNGKPQFFIINEAIMSKLCILGEDVEPCFEGASISKVQFSFEDNFKNSLFSFMTTMKEILSNEGGTPVFNTYAVEIGGRLWDAIYDYMWKNCRCDCDLDYMIAGIYEDKGGQKFAILQNRQDLTYYRLDFSLTDEEGFMPNAEMQKVTLDFNPSDNAQFALEDVQKFETEFKKKKEEEKSKEKTAEDKKPKDSEEEKSTEKKEEEKRSDSKEKEEKPTEEKEEEKKPSDEGDKAPEEKKEEDKKSAPKKKEDSKSDSDDEEDKKKKAKYNLDEVVEYQELLQKFSALQTDFNQLKDEKEKLVKFKNDIEREKKKELINNTFFMLSDEQKKDCVDNIDTYSFDEIEAKLSVICVRNKVSFVDEPTPPQEEKPTTTYNLDSTITEYDNMPAWLVRAIEVQKEGNF